MIGKHLMIVTSRRNLAEQDVVFAGANPRDPRIMYVTNPDQFQGHDRKTPYVLICASHFKERDFKELHARYGEPKTLKAGLEAVGITMDGP